MNQLLLGDNLQILRTMPDESIDLIYLDPPFFSNRTYEVIWGDTGEVRSFEDRFSGGIDHYIAWLKERVQEMHRILKPTGSIFLHCDWHADAYIRVLILDKVFGMNNFRGHIIWQRATSHNDAKKKLAVLTDTIWYYSKTDKLTYNPIYTALSDEYKEEHYKLNDNDGRGLYRIDNMASPNPRPNMMYEYKGYGYPEKGWRYEKTTMERLNNEGRIYFPKDKTGNFDFTKRLGLKRYLEEQKGQLLGNTWNDINNVQAQAKERIGYPTQKPMSLLQRIIEMASHEGDTVLDPFVGGGTTLAVADKLNRAWIGIDQSVAAVKVTEMRLHNQQDLFSKPFTTRLHKYDYDTVRNSDAFEFETFTITQYGGKPQNKKGGDKGIDGTTLPSSGGTGGGLPIQLKRSDDIGVNVVKNFFVSIMQYDKNKYEVQKAAGLPVGYIIAFSFGKGAIQEAARLRNEEGAIIELIRVDSIIAIAKKPKLSVTVQDLGKNTKGIQEITFTATAESDAGIEFYAWDWNYKNDAGFKPSIMIDKTGIQTQLFKAGKHCIMVKVIDNEGLESTEMIQLKINGKVERI